MGTLYQIHQKNLVCAKIQEAPIVEGPPLDCRLSHVDVSWKDPRSKGEKVESKGKAGNEKPIMKIKPNGAALQFTFILSVIYVSFSKSKVLSNT